MWAVISLFHKYECLVWLFITDPPYIDHSKYTGIPPAAILGEPYDIECPYESNPPAHYEWSRVPSCGTTGEPLSWPTDTILFNNNQSLRLDGVQPFHYGYYNCSATNALGIGSFCLWREIDGKYVVIEASNNYSSYISTNCIRALNLLIAFSSTQQG